MFTFRIVAVSFFLIHSFLNAIEFPLNQSYADYTPQNSGKTGIIEMPNARVMDDWHVRGNFHYNNPFIYYGIALSPLPRLEMNLRMTQIQGVAGFSPTDGYGDYKDKSIDIKFLLVREDEFLPAIAIGLDDITGTALYASKYIALSKRIKYIDLTAGYAIGRMGGNSINDFTNSNSSDKAIEFLTSTNLKGSPFLGIELHIVAGGVTKKAYLKDIEIARYKVVNNERTRSVLSLDLNNEEHRQIKLHDDDQIIVRAIPKWSETKYIELLGQVRFPGKYPIEDGETMADVITRAGGFTDVAFIKGAVFTRKSVQELQQKEMIKSVQELKQQTAYIASVPSEAKESNTENNKLLLSMVETLEKDALKNIPIGRVVISLSKNMEKFKQSPYNVAVEDGDKLYVPRINKTVTVIGEVMSSNTFIYDDKLSLEEYIQKAGGYKKESADKGGIYVVKSNGNAERLDNGYFLISNINLEHGDTIVVPKKIEVTSNMSIISGIADITYKLAVTIASLNTVGAI